MADVSIMVGVEIPEDDVIRIGNEIEHWLAEGLSEEIVRGWAEIEVRKCTKVTVGEAPRRASG